MVKNSTPLVSVIIPAYNRQELIKRSIRSIINQTYSNLEIIVVDDGSTDKTVEVVKTIKDDRIKIHISERNKGVSAARNTGIKLASSEIIALQDSDDESCPERIEKQLQILLSNDKIGTVYCGMELIDSLTGKTSGLNLTETDFKVNFTQGSYFLTPGTGTLLFKKQILEDVGYFEERMRANVDTELAIRVSKKYQYGFVKEPLIKVYRNHSQIMANTKDQIEAKEIIYEKHKEYLSKKILHGLCKVIANYYILTNNYIKAKRYIKYSLLYKIKITTVLQFLGITLLPSSIKFLYKRKYKDSIPLSSGLKRTVKQQI